MLVARNGAAPRVHPDARIAPSAQIVGNVEIGARAYVDHGAIIESSGPPVHVAEEAIVFAGAVVRSVGGTSRPAYPVAIGSRTVVSPHCVLTGCRIGANCYVAAGAIVHATTEVPAAARVG